MLDGLTFKRNKYRLKRSKDDVLFLCTDAGYHASMMILYIGHPVGSKLEIEFVFSIGNLKSESGNIPHNEIDIIERGVKQCEKLIEWMTPTIEKKILISDANVPLSWIKNKNLRTQLYV